MSDGHIKSEVSVSPIGHFQKSAALEIYLGIFGVYLVLKGLPGGTGGKEPVCQCRRCKRHKFDPWVRKIPWRRKWQPTLVFLLVKLPWTEEPGGLWSMGSQRVGDRKSVV